MENNHIVKINFKDGTNLKTTYYTQSANDTINQAKKDHAENYTTVNYFGIREGKIK